MFTKAGSIITRVEEGGTFYTFQKKLPNLAPTLETNHKKNKKKEEKKKRARKMDESGRNINRIQVGKLSKLFGIILSPLDFTLSSSCIVYANEATIRLNTAGARFFRDVTMNPVKRVNRKLYFDRVNIWRRFRYFITLVVRSTVFTDVIS